MFFKAGIKREFSKNKNGCKNSQYVRRKILCLLTPQILAASLTQCHKKSSAEGAPLGLKVFVAGRNRLENDGATALAQAFQVQD